MQIIPLSKITIKDRRIAGGKGAALGELMRAGFPVPKGFVVLTSANLSTSDVDREIIGEAEKLGKKLAIRSSALIEDGKKHSFAGQFLTLLNVKPENVIDAIKKVRASGPQMSVIIQAMVDADESGVAFSAHPVTGDRTQIVIESVRGLGDKLVSGKVTPKTTVIKKTARFTGLAKLVMDIERYFGYPVDIEWTRKGKKYYSMQARPITTL